MNNPDPKDKQIPMDTEIFESLAQYAGQLVCVFPPRHMGGTGFCNFNNNNEDGRALAIVMKECRKICDCLSLAPLPVIGITPFDSPLVRIPDDIHSILNACDDPVKIISVHQRLGGSVECVDLFKQLMVQELCAANPGNTQLGALMKAEKILFEVMKK